MGLVKTIIKEKRLVLIGTYEILRLSKKQFCHFFIPPLSLTTSRLETDTRYSVHNGTRMPHTRMHTEQLRIILTRRFTLKILPIAHINRVILLKTDAHTILYENTRNTVICGRLNKGIVIPYFTSTRINSVIPIHLAISQAQVPLTNGTSNITSSFHYFRKSQLVRTDNQCRITR